MMPPAVLDDTAPAGGPEQLVGPALGLVAGEFHLRYGPVEQMGTHYRVLLAPVRLTAVVIDTDEGYVARCAQLESLGYGASPEDALGQLLEASREYLAMLADERPQLAPRLAHHNAYVALLSVPESSWFAAVVERPSAS